MGTLVSPDPQILGSNPQAIADAMKVAFDQAAADLATLAQLFAPAGGTTDDAARLQTLLNANAYKRPVRLAAGTYLFKSICTVPNGSTILGGPGVTLVGSLASSGLPTVAFFSADIGTQGTQTTLSAAAKRGAFSIVTTASAPFAVGDIIQISNPASAGNDQGFRVSTHTVTAVAGVNANLDRPLPRDYASGSFVTKFATIPQDITIDGGGMIMTGTAVRFVELKGGRRNVVKNIICTDTSGIPTDLLFSFDGGSYDCHYQNIRITVTGATTPFCGLAFESADGCTATDCTIDGGCSYGFQMYDCSDCHVYASRALHCPAAAGFALVADTSGHAATTEGCIACSFVGCTAQQCSEGFLVRDGSLNCVLVDCHAINNTTNGIHVGDGTTSPDGTMISNCSARNNTTRGLYIHDSKVKRTQAVNLDFSNNGSSATTGTGIVAGGSLDLVNGISNGGNGAAAISATGGVQRWRNLTVVNNQVINVIALSGTTRTEISGIDMSCAAGANAINSNDPLYLDHATITGAANGVVMGSNPVYWADGNDCTGCTAEFFLNGGGSVIASPVGGVTSVAVTSADVTLTLKQAQAGSITTTGVLTGNRNVVVPTVVGLPLNVFNNNSGAFTTTVKTAAGTGIAPAQTKRAPLLVDGTNVVRMGADT